jgi:hypothetical protein
LPCGVPGRGEVMEGAMQQAAQWERQSNLRKLADKTNGINEAVTFNRTG